MKYAFLTASVLWSALSCVFYMNPYWPAGAVVLLVGGVMDTWAGVKRNRRYSRPGIPILEKRQ